MIWLAAHMWALLLASFAIGLGVGWWIWGARSSLEAGMNAEESIVGSLDSDFEPLQSEEDLTAPVRVVSDNPAKSADEITPADQDRARFRRSGLS